MYNSAGISDAVNFKLSPGIRGPEHTHAGYSCVDEANCDKETYFLCAEAFGASVNFLVCQDASDASAAAGAEACASSNKPSLDWNKITTCFGGDQGASLKKNAALYFDKLFPQPVGVPHIEINGEEWKRAGSAGSWATEMIQALCATGIKAGACSNSTEVLSYL